MAKVDSKFALALRRVRRSLWDFGIGFCFRLGARSGRQDREFWALEEGRCGEYE